MVNRNQEVNLMGICSGNEELCEFDIIDDTYSSDTKYYKIKRTRQTTKR